MMIRPIPFNIRENAERGREVLEKALDFVAEQPCNPLGRVSGAFSSFRVDVIDTPDRYEIFAELPGFHKEQITVSYDDATGYLTIKAERPDPDMDVKFICRERRTGTFERTFEIDGIVKDEVTVSFDEGVLHIVLPKEPAETNKTVSISSEIPIPEERYFCLPIHRWNRLRRRGSRSSSGSACRRPCAGQSRSVRTTASRSRRAA